MKWGIHHFQTDPYYGDIVGIIFWDTNSQLVFVVFITSVFVHPERKMG
jgi:hypothetical protein